MEAGQTKGSTVAKFTIEGQPYRGPVPASRIKSAAAPTAPAAKPKPAPAPVAPAPTPAPMESWLIDPADPTSYQRCREMAMSAWKSSAAIRAQHPNQYIYAAKVVAAAEAISAPPLAKSIKTFNAPTPKGK
jgi:hypothetical protein